MTIKSNSLIAYYYKWMFRGDLANDFCSLFWNTLFSILLLPLTFPAFLASLIFGHDVWDRKLLDKAFRGLLTYFALFLAFCFGLGTFEKVFGNAWRTWGFWEVLGAGFIGFIGLAVTIILIVLSIGGIIAFGMWIGVKVKQLFQKKVVYKTRTENGQTYEQHFYTPREFKLVAMWNAIRNKYCTKIDWK